MILKRLLPEPLQNVGLDNGSAEDLSLLYAVPQREWLRLNFIASVNGNVVGDDGTSQGLTNAVDRKILGTIRRLADIVLVGANSVRKEGYFMPKTSPLAIVTGSGNLSGHSIPAHVKAQQLLVLCPPEAAAEVNRTLDGRSATIIHVAGPRMNPRAMVHALRARGYAHIVCEGGPSLAAQLIDAREVKELCLSMSPVVNATQAPLLPGLARNAPLTLNQLLVDGGGTLYSRWIL